MRTVSVKTRSSYDVIIGNGLISLVGKYIKSLPPAQKVCIVSDTAVAPLYAHNVQTSLKSENIEYTTFTINEGEASKSPSNLLLLLEHLASNGFTRTDMIIALGGGVVGDLGGFAASVYLRGIRFVQIPTTLLAMVDSSVGGKTAVNLEAGKNLMGSFYQPSLVLCDVDTLDTLTDSIFSDGCAEVIKYGVIYDRKFFNCLKDGIKNNKEEIIEKCVSLKARTVELDEYDNGCRKLLNLGHTVGHAIELCSDFKISHGSAVAMGTVVATRIAVNTSLCPKEDLFELTELLSSHGLPTDCPFDSEALSKAALTDKKRSGDSITLILPCGIGNCKPISISVSDLEKTLRKGL